jgi:hypothetical protein
MARIGSQGALKLRTFAPDRQSEALRFHLLCITEYSMSIKNPGKKIMLKWLVWFPLNLLRWALCLVGVGALALTAEGATPV